VRRLAFGQDAVEIECDQLFHEESATPVCSFTTVIALLADGGASISRT
jgi:hypothetical protein